jgi:CrcB protein
VEDAMRYASIAVGAMLGANLRYVVANWAADRWGVDVPYRTFLINVTGAFVIGVFWP